MFVGQRHRAETDEVDGRKAHLLLETDILPLIAKLAAVPDRGLQVTVRLGALGHDKGPGILRRAIDELGSGMGDRRIVEGGLDLGDNVGRSRCIRRTESVSNATSESGAVRESLSGPRGA